MPKAVIYCRVSESRQVEGTSLESQESICRAWCQTNGLDVAHVDIERAKSAKSADRPQFQSMFGYLSAERKGVVSHLVVYKFDRFSRSVEDGAAYRMRLRGLGIALHSATEQTDNTPAGKFLTNVLSAVGQFDNDVRGERSTLGMKARLAQGRWMWRAPCGYRRGGSGEPSLVPDKNAKLVKRMFELVATGNHTKASALADVAALGLRSKKGIPLTQETVRKTLKDLKYTGRIEYPQ